MKLKAGSYETLGYRAADEARRGADGRKPATAGNGDYHLRYDRETLVKESQRFDRDNGLYTGVVNRAIDNILGSGFTLQSRARGKVSNDAEALWKEYWQDPEVRGMDSGYEIERKVLRHLFVDGDIGTIKTNLGKIQLIEAEQIASLTYGRINQYQRVEQGIYLDNYGRPVAFDVCDYDVAGFVQKQNARKVEAKDFLFLANRQRATQTRGVPVMVSSFSMFHRINDVCDSEAISWQLLARFALMISRENGPGKGFDESVVDPSKTAGEGNQPERIQEYDAATIFHGQVGEKVEAIDRKLPGDSFSASLTMFIRLLGLPLGFPLELILLDWSKTNYSSARAALEQAFRMFVNWQRRLISGFYSPLYEWKIRQWVSEGKLPDRADITKHVWLQPAFPWIDQLKEAQAWGERIDRGLATQTQACASLNMDREEWLIQRGEEVGEAIEKANELNKKYPDANVDWRIFAGMAAPDSPPSVPAEVAHGDEGDPKKKDEKNG